MNPFILFVAPLGMAACALRAVKRGEALAWFVLSLFAATYLPLLGLWLAASRISYIFYFLPSLPAVVIANAVFTRTIRPAFVRRAYLATVVLGTLAYYPFRKLIY
jgi:hypothetical protein